VSATVVIPARFGSTRFPAKIVASKTGKPLVQHVVDRAKVAKLPRQVLVATDDARIVESLLPFGTRAVMTSAAHPSGTDRVAEVARGLGDDIIVNVQGDEPEIEPGTIDGLIRLLQEDATLEMATAITRFPPHEEVDNPNLVKCVVGTTGNAIYFSRAAIPYHRDTASAVPAYYLHLGIYAYRRDFLLKLATLPPTALEQSEKLEQLRVLEHGYRIGTVTVERAVHGIDTPEQYEAFVKRFSGTV
jgi:3-deoxy-manno-octulosonate cytidylyltransferase (CMP-KDO synthetase)